MYHYFFVFFCSRVAVVQNSCTFVLELTNLTISKKQEFGWLFYSFQARLVCEIFLFTKYWYEPNLGLYWDVINVYIDALMGAVWHSGVFIWICESYHLHGQIFKAPREWRFNHIWCAEVDCAPSQLGRCSKVQFTLLLFMQRYSGSVLGLFCFHSLA